MHDGLIASRALIECDDADVFTGPAPEDDAFANALRREGELPRPAAKYVAQAVALNAQPAEDVEAAARRFVDNFRLAKGEDSPFNEKEWMRLGLAVAQHPMKRTDGKSAAIANNSNHVRAQKATWSLFGARPG